MRYLISLWLVGIALFIFSTNSQAADVVEISNHKTVKAGEKISPIEPVKPIEPKTNKSKFWQKRVKSKQQQNEVEPIASGWYIFISVIEIIGLIFSFFAILFAIFSTSLLWIFIGALGIVGLLALLLYIIKLFGAARGVEGNFLKGWRFILGYASTAFIFATWFTFFLRVFSANYSFNGGSAFNPVTINHIIPATIIGLVLALPILVFNLVDHLRYRKYLKTLESNPQ